MVTAQAQTPSSGELLRDISNLQVVGSALYVAAHPDDENTRLISWLVGERGLRTGYLSMTRGGGGQNLIGAEQAELLGVVRTGELLAARSIDGAEQLFTRARDFGYSKSPDETLALWGHEEALSDVVLALRTFKPDVLVTRFSPDGGGHGHHTASARLAFEAFEAAADPARFPGTAPWQVDRLLTNRSTWRRPDADTSAWMQVDAGTFDARTGRSYGEVAAASRTMHKSQGFGSSPQVGPVPEHFSAEGGTSLTAADDPFGGLDLTWSRLPDTARLVKALRLAEKRFDPAAPHTVLPTLATAHALMGEVADDHWRTVKLAALERVMADCAGLWLTAHAEGPAVSPGGSVKVTLGVVQRAPADVRLDGVTLAGTDHPGGPLDAPWSAEVVLDVPSDAPLTRPHWLAAPPTPALYTIPDAAWRTAADTPPRLQAAFHLTLAGRSITLTRPVEFAWTDPVDGARAHPVEVLPPVTATFEQKGLLLPIGTAVTARVTLRADAAAAGTLVLEAPEGVTVSPDRVSFSLDGGERVVEVTLSSAGGDPGVLTATADVGGSSWSEQRAVIDHRHLPRRTILTPATLRLVPVDLDRGDTQRIAYVPGSGDAVPAGLRAAGYTVEELDEDALLGDLSGYDAIVMGIRAYNTRPRLMSLHGPLMAYVAGGGRLVVQYNTNSRWRTLDGPIGPFPFTISRLRVTDETAEMVPVDPAHAALIAPNVLGPDDFAGWVQERGLYFADAWDAAYQPLFAAHDPGEEPLQGGTLVARHGDGVFVYTGLSFFRQLPAGVPGAYRLLANLLAL